MNFHFNSFYFNWLDIFFGVILVFFIFRSLWTGFSRSLASLLGLIFGFWIAGHRFSYISLKLSPWMQDEMWRSFVSFLLIFLVIYLVFFISGIIVQRMFKALNLSWFDRLLGAAVGLAKGLVLAGAIVFMLTIFLESNNPLLRNSCLYPALSRVAQVMGSLVPGDLKGRFMWKFRKFHSVQDRNKGHTQEI